MRPTVLLAFITIVGVVASLPMPQSSSPDRDLQRQKFDQWPGVEDERDADAEHDSAYEIYKDKTRKPRLLTLPPNAIAKRASIR